MKREFQTFLAALSFYTRIPVHSTTQHFDNLNKSIRYFPLIGWLTGCIVFSVFHISGFGFNQSIAIVLAMLGSVLLTGGLHEDGLADVCDGFGGGWSKERILAIMKDSRVGVYGVLGLVFSLALKFLSLQQIATSSIQLLFVFVIANTLSRFAAMSMVFTHQYVRESDSKSIQMISGSRKDLFIGMVFTLIPLLGLSFISDNFTWLVVICPVGVITWYLGHYFNKWIGGYTGDCLGAIQQISELVIYLTISFLWRFI